MNDDWLGEELCKRLKDKKFLIVIDDIWSLQAWTDIGRSFKRDHQYSIASVVIFTTRLAEVAKVAHHLYDLQPLSIDHSWELFQKKVFGKQNCPALVADVGLEIAEKCKGRPLALVVIAGLLAKTNTKPECWKEVAESLSSVNGRSQLEAYMDTLALSYNHLPLHLKACFLYLGLFPEDYEVPARRLVWLWIAEGFVKHSSEKSLEAVAADYLQDLVDRNLIMVARKSCNGGIKTCRIHDFLRDLCLRKADQGNFLRYFDEISRINSSSSSSCSWYRRLGINRDVLQSISSGNTPNIRSILSHKLNSVSKHMPKEYFPRDLHRVRVLDLLSIETSVFPKEIGHLVHLRYLALRVDLRRIPPSISKPRNLETIIISTWRYPYGIVNLPPEMWNMVKLRHLSAKGGVYHFDSNANCPPFSLLENLQTMKRLCPCKVCQELLARTPNLKNLEFCGGLALQSGFLVFPDVKFLEHLETLRYTNTDLDCSNSSFHGCSSNLRVLKLPTTVKKLCLEGTYLKWEEISVLRTSLPKLEVLKLSNFACGGPIWETDEEEEGFCKLKYLKLQGLPIEEWNASQDHFPCLEILVIDNCWELNGIPSVLSEIPGLQKIEMRRCLPSVGISATHIKEERIRNTGDDSLQILE